MRQYAIDDDGPKRSCSDGANDPVEGDEQSGENDDSYGIEHHAGDDPRLVDPRPAINEKPIITVLMAFDRLALLVCRELWSAAEMAKDPTFEGGGGGLVQNQGRRCA